MVVARRTRKWAQAYARRTHLFGDDLSCMCAIAAARLWNNLTRAGYNPILGYSRNTYEGHVYIIVDETIYDITATQFGRGMKPIEVRTITVVRQDKQWYWRKSRTFSNPKELLDSQIKENWPEEQRVLVKDA